MAETRSPVVIGSARRWTWHGEAPEPGDVFLMARGSVRLCTAYLWTLAERFQTDPLNTRHRIEVVLVDPDSIDLADAIAAYECCADGTPR